MIQAVIFDLDGTLVQTERLKALSYARAALELRPDAFDEEGVFAAFRDVVGLSRQEVATTLVERFDLKDAAQARMAEFGVATPWQAYLQLRLRHYETLIADPDVLRNSRWPHTVNLLHAARQAGCRVGLATMSYCPQVQHVLAVLELADAFDFIATRDDVEHGKPDPEIYLLVAKQLAIVPHACLVIEDSPTGVKAAQAAGMPVIAVSTPFTRDVLHAGGLLDKRWIVDDPHMLPAVLQARMEHQTVPRNEPQRFTR